MTCRRPDQEHIWGTPLRDRRQAPRGRSAPIRDGAVPGRLERRSSVISPAKIELVGCFSRCSDRGSTVFDIIHVVLLASEFWQFGGGDTIAGYLFTERNLGV